MEAYKLIEHFLQRVGLYRSDAVNVPKYKPWIVLSYLGMSSLMTFLPIPFIKDGSQLAQALFLWFTISIIFGVDAGLISQATNFYIFIDKCNEIIKKRAERPDLKLSYEKMNQRNKIYANYMHLALLTNCMMPLGLLFVYKIFIYFTNGFEDDDYRLLAPVWLPFDYKSSLVPYLIAFAIQSSSVFLVSCVGFPIMCLLVESFLVLTAFTEDIIADVVTLNENWRRNQNQVELIHRLNEFNWFNIKYNELLSLYNIIFEPLTIFNLTWSLFSICDAFLLLTFELGKDPVNYGAVAISSLALIMAFGLVFLFTEIGEQLESRSDEIDEAINELDWNTFPPRAQRMMPIMIVTTQNPIQVTAFGGIPCTRETFKKIVNTSYSYFNVFSQTS